MSTVSAPPIQTTLAQRSTFRRISVAEYHELIRLNFLTTEDRVELIDGYLVNKRPQNDPHASTVDRLDEDLKAGAPTGWRVRVQLPITLANSEPEPDAVVVRGDRRTYDHRRPSGSDFGVVVEVADSSLRFDQVIKLPLYAAAGIPVYWIVNLIDRQIEVYTDPDPPAYRTRTEYAPGQSVPLVLDGTAVAHVAVDELLA